jgi:hypothetical protein
MKRIPAGYKNINLMFELLEAPVVEPVQMIDFLFYQQ